MSQCLPTTWRTTWLPVTAAVKAPTVKATAAEKATAAKQKRVASIRIETDLRRGVIELDIAG